jgi:hypothetical protein
MTGKTNASSLASNAIAAKLSDSKYGRIPPWASHLRNADTDASSKNQQAKTQLLDIHNTVSS